MIDDNAHKHLRNVGFDKWPHSLCSKQRYSFETSGAIESLNNRLLRARNLLIYSILECIWE